MFITLTSDPLITLVYYFLCFIIVMIPCSFFMPSLLQYKSCDLDCVWFCNQTFGCVRKKKTWTNVTWNLELYPLHHNMNRVFSFLQVDFVTLPSFSCLITYLDIYQVLKIENFKIWTFLFLLWWPMRQHSMGAFNWSPIFAYCGPTWRTLEFGMGFNNFHLASIHSMDN